MSAARGAASFWSAQNFVIGAAEVKMNERLETSFQENGSDNFEFLVPSSSKVAVREAAVALD